MDYVHDIATKFVTCSVPPLHKRKRPCDNWEKGCLQVSRILYPYLTLLQSLIYGRFHSSGRWDDDKTKFCTKNFLLP